MLEQIRHWIKSPIFPDDEDKTRMAKILYMLLRSTLIFVLVSSMAIVAIVVQKLSSSIILLTLFICVLTSYGLTRHGHVLAASRLYVVSIWILFTLSMLLTGRINTTSASLQLAVVVMAAILLGKRSAILLTLLSIFLGLGITLLELLGYPLIHYFPMPPLTGWVTWVLAFILVLTPLNPTVQNLARSVEQLHESQERYKLATTAAKTNVWELNIKTGEVITEVHSGKLGYSEAEYPKDAESWQARVHPNDLQSHLNALQAHLIGQAPDFLSEHRVYQKDGSIRWLLTRAEAQRDKKGNPVKVLGTSIDITERKQVEVAEHEQRALAEALVDSAAALNNTLKFHDVLDRVLDNVGKVVPHDATNIMLLNADGDTLSVACHRGYVEHGVKNEEIERQFSLATMPILIEVSRTGQSLAIPDTQAAPGWTAFPATKWVNSFLTVPIQIRQTTVGFLNMDSETTGFFNSDHAERLQAFAHHAAIAINNAQLYEDLKIMAVTDALTSIYNRVFFEAELARIELGRDYPVSIVVADLDNLKTTNDVLGHLAGDKLIKSVAQILQETFRAADIIARIGGDEFSVLLPDTDAKTAENMLSRVRTKIIEHNAAYPDIPVQLSLGAATAEPEQGQLMEVFNLADQRMYEDKAMRKSSGSL